MILAIIAEVELESFDNGVNKRTKRESRVKDDARLRASGEGVVVTLSMVSEIGPCLFRMDQEQTRRSSVLSVLSLRKLWDS